jgi:3-deoxy-D-manno-octulosonic-acid transferase
MDTARAVYSVLGAAALPWLPLRLWWRGRSEPGYREHIAERFGHYPAGSSRDDPGLLWLHAVSVGETRAAAPLVQRLRHAYPGATILMTHMTATGRETGRALFGDQIVQAWLPYDIPFAVRAFYDHFRPVAGFLLETELWPNLVAEAHSLKIPIYLVNARLSERSARGYARFAAITRPMLVRLAGVAAQSDADAARLSALGAREPIVTGNLKFDLAVPPEAGALATNLRHRYGASRRVWVAGSTRDGEEALILDALAQRPLPRETLLVIVPRHPQRFAAVAELLRSRGVPFVRRSELDSAPVTADVAVVLGDSMGEMLAYYAAAGIAFVGGSLLPLGGQNLIEPLAVGTPVLIGPHTFNFTEASQGAIEAGAAQRVADANALVETAAVLLGDDARRAAMSRAASAFHALHAGAADRLWGWLASRLPAPDSLSRRGSG